MILGGPAVGLQKILLIPFMIIGCLIIYTSTLAEVNRTPFDIPEAESELSFRLSHRIFRNEIRNVLSC